MGKEIVKTLVTTLVTAIITLFASFIIGYFNNPSVKVTYGYSKINDDSYVNTIMIKNIKKDAYIKNFNAILDSSIKVQEVLLNNESIKIDDNTINIDSIKPNDTITLSIITNKKTSEDDYNFVNNDKKVQKEYFNKYTNVPLYTLLIIFIYAIINFLISLRNDYDNVKIKEQYDLIISDLRNDANNTEERVNKLFKESNAHKTLYIKEMSDMERELDFYKSVIIKICGKELKKEELESIVSKNIKTFSKRNLNA